MQNGKVVSVLYGKEGTKVSSSTGVVTLGIINQEQATAAYRILLKINENQADFIYRGESVSQLGPVVLLPGEKWESEVEFAPYSLGDKEKVEFLLLKDNSQESYRDLHFWIDVK